jgi:hypothetical protein
LTRLKLSHLASISEIGAAIVVVLSLLFIYQELQQNTKSTQDASYRQFLSNLTDLELAEASDPELTRISILAKSNPDELSDLDWARFTRIASARIAQMEYAFISKTNGTMSELHWEAVHPHMQLLLCQLGDRMFLDEGGSVIYATAYLEFINETMYQNWVST